MTKWVYTFGGGEAEGNASRRDLLGGKGANLAEMACLGLAVPPGFTLTTEACNHFYHNDYTLSDENKAQLSDAIAKVEANTNRQFGGDKHPLLVSVRSGAKDSMPGMMDTVLNLGLNDQTVIALAEDTKDERFAYDSYRRFIQMYSNVVLDLDHDVFEEVLDDTKSKNGYENDTDLSGADLKILVDQYKALVKTETDKEFPQDIYAQLHGAIAAVFLSWRNIRAKTYRQLNKISHDLGTAATIQAMVFGNMGEDSATGVAFTRNPSTGANALYGEFLVNAQGEDVVAGLRTPHDITEAARIEMGSDKSSLEKLMPEAFEELGEISKKLEAHYKDMQDMEFTIERGKLWMLQTRSGKRTTKAALRIAVDMVEEKVISKAQAVCMIDPSSLDQLLHPTIAEGSDRKIIGMGLPASPGAATGQIVFNPIEAGELKAAGKSVILVRVETRPEDIHGMSAAAGILTQRGGMTSHAAVVARGMGKPCVCGAGAMRVDLDLQLISVMGKKYKKGETITIDGTTGQVIAGNVQMSQPQMSGAFATLMCWADDLRRMDVRSNADTPKDAKAAFSFGADGIGLCRTEHMFFDGARINAMRLMVLAETEEKRRNALDQLLPMQREDFSELFSIMKDSPVTIRLLDPPLHEFLPNAEDEIVHVADALEIDLNKLKARLTNLKEFNPMLGHRGCRLAISFPEIVEMQAQAIFEAAILAKNNNEMPSAIEVMVPFVGMKSEFNFLKKKIDEIAQAQFEKAGFKVPYEIGAMIELPRAALLADELAETSDFFSYGTNDLTQTTLGISRDDASQFVSNYEIKGILERDPFATLDIEGVGKLIEMSIQKGRATSPNLKLGICGEHAGDPASIDFFETVGMDYISCSPFRVPIARLAAAQATIKNSKTNM